jgi:large subunit ribosomal protein L29
MTAKEIRDKETSHLTAELLDKHKHLFDLRSQAVTEKLEDPSQLRKTKLDIARIKTVLRQREIEEQKKNEKAKPDAPAKSATKSEKPEPKKTAKKTNRTTRAKKTETAKA